MSAPFILTVIIYDLFSHYIVAVVQLLSPVHLFATARTAAQQTSLFFIIPQSLLRLMSIGSVMPSNPLILCRPLFLLPSIFPSMRVFSNESSLLIRWTKHWSFSFSISPSNEYQDWFPLELIGLIFLLSKGLSRVFSSTTVWRHKFFSTQPFFFFFFTQPFLSSSYHNHTWLLAKP